MNPRSINELWMILRDRLAERNYACSYSTESEFEIDVWDRVFKFAKDIGLDAKQACLTSHAIHTDRDPDAWQEFCGEKKGPDVNVLGSNNRLDIVFKHPGYGTLGIEVKCLGRDGHAAKLTQGLGQALLGLVNRDRTILVIHCGKKVNAKEREKLRKICGKICEKTNTAAVVVP